MFRNYLLVSNITNTLSALFILFQNKYTIESHKVIIEIVAIVEIIYCLKIEITLKLLLE